MLFLSKPLMFSPTLSPGFAKSTREWCISTVKTLPVQGFGPVCVGKMNMPRSGDVMVYKKDTTLGQTRECNAQIQVLDIPNEIKVGYSPIGFVRCGRSACRISKLKWKMGKETGGKKMDDPHALKSNEMAQCTCQPQQPLVCDTFKNCEGLSRVAFMDGNGVVMLGKVVSCEQKKDGAGGGKKK
jgi:elongation factor 1-alpha